MSSRSNRRGRNSARTAQGASIGSSATRSPKRWKPVLAIAVGIIGLVIAWGGSRWLQEGGSIKSDSAAQASNASPSGASAKPSNNNEAFKTLVNRGSKLLADGKTQEALEVFSEARQLVPNDEDVHYNLGLALARLGRTDEAIEQYQDALRLFPQYVEAHNNLGNLLLRSRRIDEAIQHFEAALAISPDYASGHNNLGTALQQAGRTNEAIIHFKKAATLNPDYWQAHFNVGTSCLQAGRLEEARQELETVLRLNPAFPPAKAALAQLEATQPR